MAKGKPFILLVTGISTSGKSAAIEGLKKEAKLSHIKFHDVDGTGIPKAGQGHWRVYKAAELLYYAKKDQEKGTSTVIGGIIPSHEWIDSKEFEKDMNLHFVLLKTDMDKFTKRMKARLKRQRGRKDYLDLFVTNRKLARKLENQIINQKNGHIIDTTNMNKKTVRQELIRLINQLSKSNA